MTLRRNEGLSALTILFVLASATVFGLAAQQYVASGAKVSGEALASVRASQAARSGLNWIAQRLAGRTTADRTFIEGLTGSTGRVGAEGSAFTLTLLYLDPDNNSSTDDRVTVVSTGDDGIMGLTRQEGMTVTIPGTTAGTFLSDDFTQTDTLAFDNYFASGETNTPHGAIIPMASIGAGGDPSGLITHGSEINGRVGILRLSTKTELRLSLFTSDCFAMNVGGVCPGGCLAGPGCLVRQGLAIPLDPNGFQNYLIKIRFRLLSGAFGVYFRTSYPNQTNPATVDLGGLTGYIWQYDPGLGYIPPCSMVSAKLGSDIFGMFATRRIEKGSETCGPLCGIFSTPAPSYPFFCPENRNPWPPVDGWRWSNLDWFGKWRTASLYVFRDRMTVWVGREELLTGPGSEAAPLLVGTVPLGSVAPLLMTGDIGLRLSSGGIVDLDFIRVYPNDADHSPATFPGI